MVTKPIILIATTNQGKYREILHFLQDLPFKFISLSELKKGLVEPGEIEKTVEGNATLKAKYYGEITGLITLAEDSGLFIDELNGWPGVESARIAKNDDHRRVLVLSKMSSLPDKKRSAVFKSVIAFYNPTTKEIHTTSGETEGRILKEVVGNPTIGFGYNPIFFVNEEKKSYGEMTIAEKNGCSHRGKALIRTKYYLQNNFGAKQAIAPCALIIRDGKILLNKRNDPHRMDFHGKWEFPGGGVEFGEKIEDNLKRETWEETGFRVQPMKLLQTVVTEIHKFPNFDYQVFLLPYVCKIVSGKGKFCDAECLESRWFDLEEALDYPMIGLNKKMFKALLPELKEIISIYNL